MKVRLTPEAVNEANQAHAVNYFAIVMFLLDKGIMTNEEYLKYRLMAQHEVEQEFARKRDANEDKI